MGDAIVNDVEAAQNAAGMDGATIRLDTTHFAQGQVRDAAPIDEEEEAAQPTPPADDKAFTTHWEPEYEQPMGEYVPPQPIIIHPRSRLRELKKKLVAGPEKRYYQLSELGLGKLQIAMFVSLLVLLGVAATTVLYALGKVGPERMKLLVFGQFFAMLLSALLGSFQLVEGVADLLRKRFTLNTLLVAAFILCCVDGVFCLMQVRMPCCAAFCLMVFMSLWQTYEVRNTELGMMDTMRKATHLNSLELQPDYHEGKGGLLKGEGQVEDFMDHYNAPSKPEKIMSWYALAVLAAAGIESLLDLRVDGLFGLGIACFIVHSGWSLAGDTVSSLLGENADPELRSRIVSYIERQPKVLGFHDLMVHDYGPGQRFATLHVEMDYREDPMECHECIDDMERECLRSHNVHLVIHYDPVITDDPVAQQLKERVTGLLQQRDPRLRLHDFRMVRGRRHQNLVFDVSLPEELADQKQLLRSFIEDTLNAQGPGAYHVHITYDNAAFES